MSDFLVVIIGCYFLFKGIDWLEKQVTMYLNKWAMGQFNRQLPTSTNLKNGYCEFKKDLKLN